MNGSVPFLLTLYQDMVKSLSMMLKYEHALTVEGLMCVTIEMCCPADWLVS